MQEKTRNTPRHKPGFNKRLHVILDNMNLPQHGRISFVAKLAEMTVAGAKALFDNDRPPKSRENFDALIKGLNENLGNTESDQLEDFLLNDSPGNFTDATFTGGIDNPVYIGKIYIKVSEIASETGLDLFEDIEKFQLETLYRKVIAHCGKYQLDPQSADVRATIESLLHLAQKELL